VSASDAFFAGLRLLGGHSARATGAKAYVSSGLDVNKVRILARHSGETILGYVGDAPVRDIASDLAAASSQARSSVPSSQVTSQQLKHINDMLDRQAARLDALYRQVMRAPGKVYVLNLQTEVLHATRPGDGAYTACGWWLGGALRTTQRQGSTHKWGGMSIRSSCTGHPFQLMCEKCLQEERRSEHLSTAPELDSGKETMSPRLIHREPKRVELGRLNITQGTNTLVHTTVWKLRPNQA